MHGLICTSKVRKDTFLFISMQWGTGLICYYMSLFQYTKQAAEF